MLYIFAFNYNRSTSDVVRNIQGPARVGGGAAALQCQSSPEAVVPNIGIVGKFPIEIEGLSIEFFSCVGKRIYSEGTK